MKKNIYKKKLLRGNALIEYKQTLNVLSQEQRDIIIGTLLGDASMEKGKNKNITRIK